VDGHDVFVSVGAQHIRSWTVQVRKLDKDGIPLSQQHHELQYKKVYFGNFNKYVTFTCLTFAKTLVVIGAEDGSIYLMSNDRIVNVVEFAHQSSPITGLPVLDLDYCSDKVISAGSDGKVAFWDLKDLTADDNQAMLIRREGTYDIGEIAKRSKNLNQVEASVHAFTPKPNFDFPVSVKSVKCLAGQSSDGKSTDEMQILMGTGSNEIILRSSRLNQSILMQGHLGGCVTSVAAHPSKLIFATAGKDKSMKIWDAEKRVMLAMGFAEAEVSCIDWAPKAGTSHHLAAALEGGDVTVFQYTQGRPALMANPVTIKDVHRRKGPVCIKYSPDSMLLVVGSVCGHIDVFDVIQGYVWKGCAQISSKAVRSVDWSYDCQTIQACTQDRKLSYWDVSRKDVETFGRKNKEANRDQVWGSWSSAVGWPVTGISWEKNRFTGNIRQIDVLTSVAGSLDIQLVKGTLDVPNLLLATTRDSIHLLNFPVLPGAEFTSFVQPAIQTAAACFSHDGSRVYSVGGEGLCILQWRLVLQSEIGLSGIVTRAQRAAKKSFTLVDREKFWKISRKEIDELKRRGVRSGVGFAAPFACVN
jgi:WD40 repeat protein